MLLSAPESAAALLPLAAPPAGNSAVSPTYIIDGTGRLYTVNDTTGQTQLIGPRASGVVMSDIALAPSGQMYGMGQDGNLYQINDATGAASLVGPLVDQSTGQPVPYDNFIMAFRGDGTLFVATESTVYQVNPQTATAQQVLTNGEVLTSEGIMFDQKGDLYLTEGDGSLVEVNPGLTSLQTVGNTGVGDLYGLAWSGGALYGFGNSENAVYQINPDTAATSLQASLNPIDRIYPDNLKGATSLPPVTSTALSLSPGALPGGTVGAAYSQSITAGGGSGALHVSDAITSGAVPAGLSLSASGGTLTISGTPTAAGSVSFSVTATDSNNDAPVTQNYTLTVNSNTVGSPTYFIDEQGNLFTVNDTNGQTKLIGRTSTIMYDIALSPSGQMYGLGEDGNLYQINDGTAATTLVGPVKLANGQPILSGANGMEFRGDGMLFVSSEDALYQVNPQTAVAEQVLTLPNNEQSAGDLVFDTSGDMFMTTTDGSLIEANRALTSAGIVGNTGVDDLFGLVISGGTLYGFGDSEDAIYQINPATAALTQVATFTPTDGVQPVGVNGATTPVTSTALSLSPGALPGGTVGAAYSQSITAGGGSGALHVSDAITSGAVPAGLSLSASGGTLTISGTPTAAGSVSFSVTATDSNNDAPVTQNYTLTVNAPTGVPPVITSGDGTAFTVGQGGGFLVTATGSPTPVLTESGTLPAGVAFVPDGNGTATLQGVPAPGTNGTYRIGMTAHNGVGADATQQFTLTVNPAPASPPPAPVSPPPAPAAPPALNVPPLLAFIDRLLGGVETVNGNGTETITDRLFGLTLLVSTFDASGDLMSVDLFGVINVTFLFG